MEDVFAAAFQDMAEERRKMPFEQLIELIKASYDELASEAGGTPDVVIIMAAESDIVQIGNGLTDERALWLMESVKHGLLTGGE